MPVSNRLPTRLVGLGLLSAFVAVAVYGRAREIQRVHPFGRFNEPQIMERAAAVSSTLLTQVGPLHTTLQQTYRENRDGTEHPFWLIDYSTDANDSVLRLGFDGETGELHFAGVSPVKNSLYLSYLARPGMLSSEAAVLKVSRDWVYTLGLAPKLAPWAVTRTPTLCGTLWNVQWKCRDHVLNFSFDHKTGRLIMAQVRV